MRRPPPVRHLPFRDAEAEADGIAAEISRRIDSGKYRPRDFAALVRSNGETDAIVRSLLVRGIPAHNGARPKLYSLPAVRPLVAFLRVVANPSSDLELYALATAQPYALPGELMVQLLADARRTRRSLWQVLQNAGEQPEWRGSRPPDKSVAQLVDHVRKGIASSTERTSGEVLYSYLAASGVLGRLARMGTDEAALSGLRGVTRFFELVRAKASLLALDRVAFLVPHLDEGEDIDEPDAGVEDSDRVSVLTVHRAKGLEFRVVFVAGMVDGRFPVRTRPPLLALPAELLSDPSDEDAALAEDRRLCYVAMTRARDELYLSSHALGPGGKTRRRPSIFIAEALDLPVDIATAAYDASSISAPAVPAIEAEAMLPASNRGDRRLSLSFSQVDEYLSCPERYRLRYDVGLPVPAHHALSYGIAMHHAVAAFHLAQGDGRVMSEDELFAALDRAWRSEGFLSQEHEHARYAAARDSLLEFRRRRIANAEIAPEAIERPFTFRLGHDEVRGRIDRLDRTVEGAVITDYKTSDVRDQRRADARARDSLQLQVYALAYQAETGTAPARMQLHFLDSGLTGTARPDPKRLDRALTQLTQSAEGIRARRFEAKPSPITCAYCPYRSICTSSAA